MRRFRFGAVNVIVEVSASVKLNVLAPTAIDSTVAVEPETLMVTPATLNTVSVVKLTSSAAAIAKTGITSAMVDPIAISFLMTCGC